MKTALRIISFVLGFFVGYQIGQYVYAIESVSNFFSVGIGSVSASTIFYLISGFIIGFIFIIIFPLVVRSIISLSSEITSKLKNISTFQLILYAIVLVLSLVIATLICTPVYRLSIPEIFKVLAAVLIYGLFIYLPIQLVSNRNDELYNFINGLVNIRKEKTEVKPAKNTKKKNAAVPKILDTSVIVDGRIFDILKTGFIDGPIVVPMFVIDELQLIADSSDALKRQRGRRGLDILNEIQKDLPLEVQINERNYNDTKEVDTKLIKLAKDIHGKIVTNDFNLNKVAEIQGIEVLNTNDLSNAVKLIVLPGEKMTVQVIREGKENGQGIAYLDDGTMIVVENGSHYIGETVNVIVTSILQTSAGRMVFVKPTH